MLSCVATLSLSFVLGANSISCQEKSCQPAATDDVSGVHLLQRTGVRAEFRKSRAAAAQVDFIIGTGPPKTATASLRKALEILGRHAAHGDTMFSDAYNPSWDAVYHGDSGPALEKLFQDGYNATAGDSPWCYLYEDLMRLKPNHKVIMSIHPRGPDAWVNSVDTWTSFHLGGYYPFYIRAAMSVKSGKIVAGKITDFPPEKVNEHLFASKLDCFINETRNDSWRERCKQGYLAHYEKIRMMVPPERLLEFNVSDGWAPLCNFLSLPVPDSPFPDVNDRTHNHPEWH